MCSARRRAPASTRSERYIVQPQHWQPDKSTDVHDAIPSPNDVCNGSSPLLAQMDIETGKTVAEWGFQKDGTDVSMRDLINETKGGRCCLVKFVSQSRHLSAVWCVVLWSVSASNDQ